MKSNILSKLFSRETIIGAIFIASLFLAFFYFLEQLKETTTSEIAKQTIEKTEKSLNIIALFLDLIDNLDFWIALIFIVIALILYFKKNDYF